jgi:hypothetical protein
MILFSQHSDKLSMLKERALLKTWQDFFLTSRTAGSFQFLVNMRTSPMLMNLDIGSLGHDCNLLSHSVMYWADDNHKKVCKICTPFVVGNTIHPSLINLIGIIILDGTSFENCKDSQNSC